MQVMQAITEDDLADDDDEIRADAFMCRNRRPPLPAFTTLVSLLHASVLKHTLDSNRWAPGDGLEPLFVRRGFIPFVRQMNHHVVALKLFKRCWKIFV
jgi:hypothetical protein